MYKGRGVVGSILFSSHLEAVLPILPIIMPILSILSIFSILSTFSIFSIFFNTLNYNVGSTILLDFFSTVC